MFICALTNDALWVTSRTTMISAPSRTMSSVSFVTVALVRLSMKEMVAVGQSCTSGGSSMKIKGGPTQSSVLLLVCLTVLLMVFEVEVEIEALLRLCDWVVDSASVTVVPKVRDVLSEISFETLSIVDRLVLRDWEANLVRVMVCISDTLKELPFVGLIVDVHVAVR